MSANAVKLAPTKETSFPTDEVTFPRLAEPADGVLTWMEWLKRGLSKMLTNGVAVTPMTAKPQQTDAQYFRVPWAALAIIASLCIALYVQRENRIQADQARAVEMQKLTGEIDKLNALLVQQNTTLQKADENASMALDTIAVLRIEMARKGMNTDIPTREK